MPVRATWPGRESPVRQEEVMTLKCDRCHRETTEKESFSHLSQTLCEDCYLDVMKPAKACDPWAVYLATRSRESSGLKGTEGLTPRQKLTYELVVSSGKVTAEEVMEKLALPESTLQAEVAVLRHCELVSGRKEGNTVYLVPYS
jgi:late competence protein required for DNA uptake (superfamily II DNA/RNA helicase)